MATLNCPSCAGSIEGISPLIRSIDCSYCGAWLRLSNQLWKAEAGQKVPLAAPAYLRVGMHGKAQDGLHYTIRGRLRFRYGLGSWDEWWMENERGEGFWVEEDDGVYYRHAPGKTITLPAGGQQIGVGQNLSLPGGLTLLVTEKFQASIIGREGMLPVEPNVADSVTYVDGVANGQEYSLEIEGEHASLSQAEEFAIRAVRWEQA